MTNECKLCGSEEYGLTSISSKSGGYWLCKGCLEISNYISEWGNGMVRCNCGLAVANDKMRMHLEGGEHGVKVFSDTFGKRK
jgi:hypothetical protein